MVQETKVYSMAHDKTSTTALRVSSLPHQTDTTFAIRPDSAALQEIATSLQLLGLRKLSFDGAVSASGSADWQLKGQLGATVVQPCAVTLAPVTTRIDVPVTRLYQRDYHVVDAPEAEMPEDDNVEPLGAWIDPAVVMVEALDLALPMFPRADGAELGSVSVSEPGVAPMSDDDAKPFAGLAALKQQLEAKSDEDENPS